MSSVSCSYFGDQKEKLHQVQKNLDAIMQQIKTELLEEKFHDHPKQKQIVALVELISKSIHTPEDQNLISIYIKRLLPENGELFQQYKDTLDQVVYCQKECTRLSKIVTQGG